MKLAFFEIEEWEKDYVGKKLADFKVHYFSKPLSQENISLVKDVDIISGFVDSPINKEILDGLPQLKMIAARSTGFDHIDLRECKKRKIIVCNVPHYGENTVAEHAFALMLDLSRKIYDSIEKVKKEGFSIEGLTGFDLKGKTLGIVGMGHIGQHVARIANGFEMNVLGYDKFKDKSMQKSLGFTYVSLPELLKHSDIISLHMPYNEKTHHLLNHENMRLIKKGAYLINTARGGIVETNALAKALADGTLAGAGLDVLEEEQSIKEEKELMSKEFGKSQNIKTMLQNHVLMEQNNVIITPHNAFNSKEALIRILETTVENIEAFAKGKPINIVK